MKTDKNPANQMPSDGQESSNVKSVNRRSFLQTFGLAIPGAALIAESCSPAKKANQTPVVPGFEKEKATEDIHKNWSAISDRKIKVGIIGYGASKFGSQFGFQNHPNVEIVAVSDLIAERRDALAKECRCSKTYNSLEELVKDDNIEAVFIATDAPSHAKHTIEALKHGKHVAVAVPAVFGSLEEADQLFAAVRASDRKYMMFETSMFHDDLWAMRQIYRAGGFGEIIYSEGSYFHYTGQKITDSHGGWRKGLPPQWYPTHATAYHVGVTNGSFLEVSCLGKQSIIAHRQAANNRYKNPFGTEIAQYKTSDGGISTMSISFDSFGFGREGGSLRGQTGSYNKTYQGEMKTLPDLSRPSLPPGMEAGSHGGSHGRLTNEFISSILLDKSPLVDIQMALNLTVPGIVAHMSAIKNGEMLKIPQYKI